jgi:hypothetical protein
MVNRILAAAVLCAGVAAGGLPVSHAHADDATTTAAPTLDLADQPTSDDELKKEAGTPPQSTGVDAGGIVLPNSEQAIGTAPSFDSGATSTLGVSNSLNSVSTLSATISDNGFQN